MEAGSILLADLSELLAMQLLGRQPLGCAVFIRAQDAARKALQDALGGAAAKR